MSKPVSAGCRAEVVGGLLGRESPNLGLIVRVLHARGEHSVFGPIWRCEAEYAERAQEGRNVPAGQVDFAQDWLRRLPDDPTPPAAKTINAPDEVTA